MEAGAWIEVGQTNIALTPPLQLGIYAGTTAASGTLTVDYGYFTEYFGIRPIPPTLRMFPAGDRHPLTPTGTTPGLHSIAVSPDNTIIATGDEESVIRFWSTASRTITHTLQGHGDINQNDKVNSMAFSPDGTKLVSSGGLDGTIRLWNTSTGAQIRKIETPHPTAVAFTPDGSKVISGSHNTPYLRMWHTETGALFKDLPGHNGSVKFLAVSPGTGNTFASAGSDGSIRVWNANTGTPFHTFTGHRGGVTGISFLHPNGSLLASAGKDSTLRWWGVRNKRLARLRSYPGNIWGVRVSPNYNIMVTASRGIPHNLQVWDASTSHFKQAFAAHTSTITGLEITSDSSAVVTGSLDGSVFVWSINSLNASASAPQLVSRFGEQVESISIEPVVKQTALFANYPNPFNPETWIPYQLSAPADVRISIYSVEGTLVRTLPLGAQAVGVYTSRARAAYWDGHNNIGEPVASGIYFYTLKAGEFSATRRMLILK